MALTFGRFFGSYQDALVGKYSNIGGDFGVGFSYLRTISDSGTTHGWTMNLNYGRPEIGGHVTVGYGDVFNVEVYQNGQWVTVK